LIAGNRGPGEAVAIAEYRKMKAAAKRTEDRTLFAFARQ
jgi:hypothetical protein